MVKFNVRYFLSFFILTVLVLSNMDVSTALACSINPGDPWYKVDAKIINNPLSNVLGVSLSPSSSLVTFTNRGLKSDLYIASKDTDGIYPGYRESQRGYRPTAGIIGNDKDPNILISVKDKLPVGVYEFYGGWSRTEIGDNNTETSGTAALDRVLDNTDNYKTKQVVKDDRPDNAMIPDPDYQTMYAFYNGSQYNIDIALNYSINNNYNPDRTKNSCKGESEALMAASKRRQSEGDGFNLLPLVLIGGLLVVAVVSTVLISKSARQKKVNVSRTKRSVKLKSPHARKK